MIEVEITEDGILVSGHAQYAPHGQDIVCAAVSALTQTLVASIEELTADEIEYSIEPGTADIKLWNLSEEASLLVDSFFVGIKAIADAYPAHVRIV